MAKFKVSVIRGFSAAPGLRGYKGKGERLHGQNWKRKAVLAGTKLNNIGMLVDFTDIRAMLDEAIAPLDHCYLNETSPFNKINPTAENIAEHILTKLSKVLPKGITVSEIEVWESDTSSAVAA